MICGSANTQHPAGVKPAGLFLSLSSLNYLRKRHTLHRNRRNIR